MKKGLLFLAFAFVYLGAAGQAKSKDHIIMKQDGKMYWIRGGQTIKMGITVPLPNGSVVYPDGSIKSAEGDVTRIEKGEKILMDGTVVRARSKKD